MLQQTRVETVIPYYGKWMERFPDIHSLAEAEEDEVLRVWQGLGYYLRARRLHEGARVVRERLGGSLPEERDTLRELPGIGDYTAGAVASIAFGEPVPAVDGNVRRVVSRLFDLPDPSVTELKEIVGRLLDPDRPGDFNQALMELGARVCRPRSPRCAECPLRSECLALERATVSDRPAVRPKKAVPEVEFAVIVAVARDEGGHPRFLMRKRTETGLLAGMWEFPGVEVEEASFEHASVFERAVAVLAGKVGLDTLPPDTSGPQLTELDTVTHVFSHLKARYRPFLLRTPLLPFEETGSVGLQWISEERLQEIPLPVAQQKIARAALVD
jgi:A/G-specific adenine glycosylase